MFYILNIRDFVKIKMLLIVQSINLSFMYNFKSQKFEF